MEEVPCYQDPGIFREQWRSSQSQEVQQVEGPFQPSSFGVSYQLQVPQLLSLRPDPQSQQPKTWPFHLATNRVSIRINKDIKTLINQDKSVNKHVIIIAGDSEKIIVTEPEENLSKKWLVKRAC